MSWLFLIGLAFDGIGAFMIALPVLSPGSAAREAARPRYGGDPWAPFVRDRTLATRATAGAAHLRARRSRSHQVRNGRACAN
jgi:hypothetical protein